jgi:hypothetical protein
MNFGIRKLSILISFIAATSGIIDKHTCLVIESFQILSIHLKEMGNFYPTDPYRARLTRPIQI